MLLGASRNLPRNMETSCSKKSWNRIDKLVKIQMTYREVQHNECIHTILNKL